MPSLFSRIRGKEGKFRSKKHGLDDAELQLPTKPRWEDAYTRTSVDPDEVLELVHRCTVELKARALDIPFLLLPFRPTSDPGAVRNFIRNYFDDGKNYSMHGEALAQELRMTEPMVISGVLKWCWSRISGGLVGWHAYELFKVGEQDSNMAPDSFSTFIPLSIESESRCKIVFDYFDLLSAIAAHGKANGLSGRKLSRMASWWAFEHKDTNDGFEGGYKVWARAADATSHLFFAYLRSLSPQQPQTATISMLPISLQKLLQETEYPPQTPTLTFASTYKVVMIVDVVSPTPFALLRRANHFQYREGDVALRDYSEYEDPVKALTEECRRVLKAISLANQSQVSSTKHSTSLRDASWSRFEDIGFSGNLEEEEEDEETVKINISQPQGLRTTPTSAGPLDRPTTPSWADFLSSGFIDELGATNTLLPPDKALPPIDTNVRQKSSQSNRGLSESALEPGELASITKFTIDEAFWWVWMSSLAPEETAERKSAFGRCAVVETIIKSGRWLVIEEMVKGAAPELETGAYIAEKKGFFSWTRRGKTGLSRSKSNGKLLHRNQQGESNGATANPAAKTNAGQAQQAAKIQAAAQQLSARQQQQKLAQQQQAEVPKRRGRSDTDLSADKTHSLLLQPMIMSEASPALKWANKYDKEAIREAYLGNFAAGRGLGQPDGFDEVNGIAASEVSESHPAERLSSVGRDSLPALPRTADTEDDSRQIKISPVSSTTPQEPKKLHKLQKDGKRPGTLKKLFGRNKNRNSKVLETTDLTQLILEPVKTAESSRAHTPVSAPPRSAVSEPVQQGPVQESPQVSSTALAVNTKVSPQVSAPTTPVVATNGIKISVTPEPELSRINTEEANEARNEFSRFDQGPLLDQPAFVPADVEGDVSDDAATPSEVAAPSDAATPSPVARTSINVKRAKEKFEAAAPINNEALDRWAAIRKNAAERAARQTETQGRGEPSKATNGDDASGEETIESRVARIKARVAELTGNMEGTTRSPVTPPAPRR